MARTVRDLRLESRTARSKLPEREQPFFRQIDQGVFLGYRKGKVGGRWLVRRSVGERKYATETFATADDILDADNRSVLNFHQAQSKARDLHQLRANQETQPDEPPTSYTVAAALEDYLTWLSENRKSAVDARSRAEALIIPKLGEMQVQELTAKRIREWLVELASTPARFRGKPATPQRFRHADPSSSDNLRRRKASANRVLTILKAALNHAFRENMTRSDAEWRRVKAYRGVDAARTRYLEIEEVSRLLSAAQADIRQLIEGALHTGCRYGELTRLLTSDVNLVTGTIKIRDSKSGKPRDVILTEDGIDFYRGVVSARRGDTLVFSRADGSRWGTSQQSRPFSAAAKVAALDSHASFHTLRHTYASHAVMNGMPLLLLAENLGHADTRMVEKHYGHLAHSFKVVAIRNTGFRFGPVRD